MVKKIIFYMLIFLVLISCENNSEEQQVIADELLGKLRALSGVSVTEVQPLYGFPRAFQIDVTQPVDHNNPYGPKFSQRIYLHHNNEFLPMVLRTAGYTSSLGQVSELCSYINSNHISVVHRYFWDAEPSPKDWQYLNIEQAAGDHHRIVTLFKEIYSGQWITTGHSKGGMTAMFHRYFYPDDVRATVAYVAPILLDLPDLRFDDYLQNQAGTEDCRQKIKDFQRMALENRQDLINLLEQEAIQQDWIFSLGLGTAVEYAILEYWFYFFQYGEADCDAIPVAGANPNEIFDYLMDNSPFTYYTDHDVERYEPFYYQAFTELGYYMFIVDHIEDLLVSVTDASHRLLAPENVVMNYQSQVMRNVLDWLQNEANNFIYIYGGQDPYTIASVEPSNFTNSLMIVQPGEDHGVRIENLDQKELVLSTLENWLVISINRQSIRQIVQVKEKPLSPL